MIIQPVEKTIPIDIVGSTTFGRYPKISASQTFNMIISDDVLVPFAGHRKITTLKEVGNGREIFTSIKYQHLIAVVDDAIFIIDMNYGFARIGTLNTLEGNVFIAENDVNEIAIADGENIYIFNYATSVFQTITVDFLPVYISFQDGYFIAADGATNQWRLSDFNNGTSWPNDPSHVGALQSKADKTLATAVLNRQLYVMGSIVSEPWYDEGYQLFPYQRNNYYNIDYGTLSNTSIATGFDRMVWLGANEKSGPAIMVTTGSQPQQISNDGINFELASLTNPQDSFGFIFRQDGHVFYVATFPTDNKTYAFDFNTNKFFTLTDENLDCFVARRVAYFNNSYFFVSFKDGNLYELNSKYTTYDGEIIPRFRICDHIRLPDNSRFGLKNIFITMESGESDEDSTISLSLSKDGGISFGTIMSKQLPALAKRQNQQRFWQLGTGNDLIPKFAFWGKGRFVVNNAVASVYQ